MIPDEAVEAAARTLHDGGEASWLAWDDIIPSGQEAYRSQARNILEAAAPHLLAAQAEPGSAMQEAMNLAWHEGYGAGKSNAPFVSPYKP